MTALRLGIIGLSPGNGHPYSWSAICNGYDPEAMSECGFPAIPGYLRQHRFPEDCLQDARVTHVWTQDRELSLRISRASRVPHIVDNYEDMIGQVDGILLARDDAEQHYRFAEPFLRAGLPVYIDKPLALSRAEAQRLLSKQVYPGQIFSCSALRYAREFQLNEEKALRIGPIRKAQGIAPKSWDKYAVHVIEPLLLLLPRRGKPELHKRWVGADSVTLHVLFQGGAEIDVTTTGGSAAPLALRLFGEFGWCDLVFDDAFAAFKSALAEFVAAARGRNERISSDFMLEVVDLIELGRNA